MQQQPRIAENLLQTFDATASQAGTLPAAIENDIFKRRSIGVPARASVETASPRRPSLPHASAAQIAQPGSALQYLADKGTRVQNLEAEVSTAQAEIMKITRQLEDVSNTARNSANSLAIVEGERDFLADQRNTERQEMEQHIKKAEQKISALRQELRQSEAAQVRKSPLCCKNFAQDCTAMTMAKLNTHKLFWSSFSLQLDPP